jgi:hypothetical protein
LRDTFSSGMDEILVVISVQSIFLFVRISHAVKIEIKQQFNILEILQIYGTVVNCDLLVYFMFLTVYEAIVHGLITLKTTG